MARDPDFIVQIDGEDITKYVMAWTITENDDAISSIMVQLGNPDMRLSGSIPFYGQLSLMYGYAEMSFDTVYGEIKSITEDYAPGFPTIKITAECGVSDLHEYSAMGHGGKGQTPSQVAIDTAKKAGVALVFKDLENPPLPKHQAVPLMPGSLHQMVTHLSSIMQPQRPTWGLKK